MQQDTSPDIYLASNSPRRRELLDQIGVRYDWLASGVDERIQPGEGAEVFVLRLALDKARAASDGLSEKSALPVLAADTVVVVDQAVLGKPESDRDGLRMLELLSGRSHRVLTGVAMVDGEREGSRLSVSHVSFREITQRERENYWATGEPRDKAGGYAIQGRAAVFIEQLEGSFSGVMGLPLFETAQLLEEFGIDYRRHW